MGEVTTFTMAEQGRQTTVKAVQEYGKRLFRFIRNKVRTDEDAEDILQDVWQQLSSVVDAQPVEQVGSWLFTVARNRVIDSYRKKKPVALEDFMAEDEDGEVNFKDILLIDNHTPETEHLKQMFWQELKAAQDKRELAEKQNVAVAIVVAAVVLGI